MALDGLTIYGIICELNTTLKGGKIDKITQPEKDEVLFAIRNEGKTHKLLISASSSNPRIYLTESYKKENPLKAPMFLMILRKYLQGGRIISISQEGLERVINIDIEALDDLKTPKLRTLSIEIMGRHSNIILVDKESNKILDSIKRIPITISSVREVLPGKEYKFAPSQNKINPLSNLSLSEFKSKLTEKDSPVYKAIYNSYDGISPLIAKEICYRSSIDLDLSTNLISDISLERIFNSFERIINQIKNEIFHPCIVIDKRLDKYIDFSLIKLTMYEFLSIENYESISLATETFYSSKDTNERLSQKSMSMRKLLQTKIERLENKLGKQLQEMNDTDKMEEYKKQADLLTANIYMLQKGMDEITVSDYYNQEDSSAEITIKLDINKTPSENIQSLYKKYNKLKTRKSELSSQISSAKEELMYLQNVMLSIESSESLNELEEIRTELYSEGYLKLKTSSKKVKAIEASAPMQFISSDNITILVGKNNKQNDELTTKLSSPDDIWLHTKDIPGSHVIIKATLDTVTNQTLEEAAELAAYFSKARMSSKVAVDYTARKNVKKPSGAKPGMVIYDNQTTVFVNPDEEKVVKLRA